MSRLPDFEALAIFAKVVQMKSFASAAAELNLSKATVSKAVSRLEARLRARLFNRTSRRLALTDAGRQLSVRAAHILAEGEAAETDAATQADAPRGLIRLTAPMSFGLLYVAPLLPEFLETYPDISIDFHLTDVMVDIVGGGFDAAIRVAALPDSSLVARTLCKMPRYLVGAPSYLAKHGSPKHPADLAQHRCIDYAYSVAPGSWQFTHRDGRSSSVRPSGPLRANNGEAMLPALVAGIGLSILPEFILREALADGRLEILLPDWSLPLGAVHWITPPGHLHPKRVEILGKFIAQKLSPPRESGAQAASRSRSRKTDRSMAE